VFLVPLLERRGAFEEARTRLDRDHSGPRGQESAALLLEAECDLVAETGAWERASEVAAAARREAEAAGLVALPIHADRLEGRAARSSGDLDVAIETLRHASEGFAALEARWEEARTGLFLAEALVEAGGHDEARRLSQRALDVFDELGSLAESATARRLLGD